MAPRHRNRSRSLVLSLGLLALAVCACLKRQAPYQATEPLEVAIAVVFDQESGYAAGEVPSVLLQELEERLTERNLEVRVVPREEFVEAFRRKRTTAHRLEHVAQLQPRADLLLLLEAKAMYYSQLNGRYRWTVDARTSLARTGALDDAISREVDYAAFLTFDHEREPEALASVAPRIADEAGRLADDFLGGLAAEQAGGEPE